VVVVVQSSSIIDLTLETYVLTDLRLDVFVMFPHLERSIVTSGSYSLSRAGVGLEDQLERQCFLYLGCTLDRHIIHHSTIQYHVVSDWFASEKVGVNPIVVGEPIHEGFEQVFVSEQLRQVGLESE